MGGGGKGGSQSQETKIPEWVRPYAEENLRLGQAVQRLGYMPYYGPDVAGFNEWDVAAAQAARQGAEAFGYEAPSASQIESMYPLGPQSSGELYDQAMAELRARRPSQMAYYDQFFVNPTESASLVAPYSLTMGQSNDPLWEQMLAEADAAHRAQFGIGWDTSRTSGSERQNLLNTLQAQYKAKKQQMG